MVQLHGQDKQILLVPEPHCVWNTWAAKSSDVTPSFKIPGIQCVCRTEQPPKWSDCLLLSVSERKSPVRGQAGRQAGTHWPSSDLTAQELNGNYFTGSYVTLNPVCSCGSLVYWHERGEFATLPFSHYILIRTSARNINILTAAADNISHLILITHRRAYWGRLPMFPSFVFLLIKNL